MLSLSPMTTGTFDEILKTLPGTPTPWPNSGWHGFWVNRMEQEIMCPNEESANVLADFLEDCGFDAVNTHFYDDEVEEFTNLDCSGWWSVYLDG